MKGTLICISADVDSTMRKILPREQNLFPVALKRKLEYEGYYLREVVDKNKLDIWWDYYKTDNRHFKNEKYDSSLVDEFCDSVRRSLDAAESEPPTITNPSDEIQEEEKEVIPLSRQYDTLLCDKYEQDIDSNTVANKLADIIVAFEIESKIPRDEILEEAIEESYDDFLEMSESESEEEEVPKKKSKTDNISVAPGEHGSFKSWAGDDIYLEEKAFNSLFFDGEGGFLSTNLSSPNPMGFAAYCRSRMRSVDPRFRRDNYYIFFLLLVKEKIEIKRSITTYMRQARRAPSITPSHIQEIRMENLEKNDKTYSVFKNMRGTAMYYQRMKKDAMAFLRQLGSPTLFVTVSFAEFHDDALFHEILETVLDRTITEEELAKMEFTATEKNKIVAENVVQTTVCFEKRLQKLMNILTKDGFNTPGSNYHASDYLYRIEFQQR